METKLTEDQFDIEKRLEEIEKDLICMEKEAENLVSGGPNTPGYTGDKQSNLILRLMLVLFRGKEMTKYRQNVAKSLSFLLIQKNGLLNFIRATCDFDQSSQKKTTFDQRFQALCTIIINMPALCCPLQEYFSKLSVQIINLLVCAEIDEGHEKPWKLAACLFSSLNHKRPDLARRHLLQPLIDGILSKNSTFTIHESLVAIHHLIVSDFDKRCFLKIFPNLYFISMHLQSSISPVKTVAIELVSDMLRFIDHSVYLLDHALSNFHVYYHFYKVGLTPFAGKNEVLSVVANDDQSSSNIDLRSLDKIVQGTLYLLSRLEDGFQIDFFLVVFSKTKYSAQNKLLYLSLIDSMQETFSSKILLYPGKAIEFISSYLKRMALNDGAINDDSIENELDNYENNELKKEINILQLDSLSGILQIVILIMEQKETLKSEQVLSLKELARYLSMIANLDVSDEEKLRCNSLAHELSIMDESIGGKDSKSSDSFYEAIKDLNSPFLPSRAHALVVLRRLIDSRHVSIKDNSKQLLALLQASLQDPESYIYIAAINALASLSLAFTDDCLPVLIRSFQDKTRSVADRIIVGEALVWIFKYLGDLSHKFSQDIIHCLLVGLKDEDEAIRVSSISDLCQFCSTLKHSLSYYIVEIISAIENVLKTDPSMNVKKACIMFVHIFLNGIDRDCLSVIIDHLKAIYRLIKSVDSQTLCDPAARIHIHLALEQIDEKVKYLLEPVDSIKVIKIR